MGEQYSWGVFFFWMFYSLFLKNIYFNWRIITLQYCDGFCHVSGHRFMFLFPFSLVLCFPCSHLDYVRPRTTPAVVLSGCLQLLQPGSLCAPPPLSWVHVAQQIRLTHSWGAEPAGTLGARKDRASGRAVWDTSVLPLTGGVILRVEAAPYIIMINIYFRKERGRDCFSGPESLCFSPVALDQVCVHSKAHFLIYTLKINSSISIKMK